MKEIWKFGLEIQDRQQVMMPAGAEILCAQLQHGVVNLWAIVTKGAALEPRTIDINGTGHPLPEGARRYLGTVQMANGSLV